ncbi:PfkB family carbohydrate kinase [Aggregatilinea lenta]|uniref:PfkB family carbohydrate kinase n=1 Tax=Aggregatilinea lenta TaxID=913108 RepID=UPI000E5B2440|nr:PfkB family carbohydrate kinase [Aggregatilinea lenta]
MHIAAVGDNCVDIYTHLNRTFPGGGPVNFAVQVRRQGIPAAYVGVIGDDLHGDWMAGALVSEGIDTRFLMRLPGTTARAWVKVEDHERIFLRSDHGVREQLVITPEIDAYLAGAGLIHTTLDGCVDAHVPGWHAAGRCISYDFSHRATPAQLALLPHIEVAFFSGQFFDVEAAREQIERLHNEGARVIVMTLGARGSLAFDGKQSFFQRAIEAKAVDTLGAGDAFQAAFMVAYLRGEDIARALEVGAVGAAQACGSLGGFGHGHASI